VRADRLRGGGPGDGRLGQQDSARDADRRALDLTDNPAERALLRRRITWP
jgi:predicted RNA polymerase sigma factor